MYPEDVSEKAHEAMLVMRVASLRFDLIKAEEELQQYKLQKSRRDAE